MEGSPVFFSSDLDPTASNGKTKQQPIDPNSYGTHSMPGYDTKQPNQKKRKLAEDDISFVELPRADLLTMSSKELEAHIKKLSALRSLTGAEQREIKRQRRLIKNREYAQTSRVKKKQFVEELRVENKFLKDRISALERENHFLRFGGSNNHGNQFQQQHFEPAPQQHFQQPVYPAHQSFGAPMDHSFNPYNPHSGHIMDSSSLSGSTNSAEQSSDEVFSDEMEHLLFPQMDQHPTYQQHNHQHISNGFPPSFVGSLCLMVVLFAFVLFTPSFMKQTPISDNHQIAYVDDSNFRTSRNLMSTENLLNSAGRIIIDQQTNSMTNQTAFRKKILTLDHVLADEINSKQASGPVCAAN